MMAEHSKNKSKARHDKYTKTRYGETYGENQNNKKGNKNKKYKKKPNPNKRKTAQKNKSETIIIDIKDYKHK